jgi:hypothetical protein
MVGFGRFPMMNLGLALKGFLLIALVVKQDCAEFSTS